MSKIFIVTSGCYSDYGIEAVFSTRGLAEKYVEITSRGDRWEDANIEEWDLDPHADEIRSDRTPFFGRITKAGQITELQPTYSPGSGGVSFDYNNNLFTTVWAKDVEHARKIISERYTVVLANGEWPEPRKR